MVGVSVVVTVVVVIYTVVLLLPVWSYGVVLWEIFSFGETPYKDIKSMHITKHVQEGKRLPCPQGCPQDV